DIDVTDDFDGAWSSLTGMPANLDTDATDDFNGAWSSLTGIPVNLDIDVTDDFDGAWSSLTGMPANLDTDVTDDFDGAWSSLTGMPTNLDTDATDDFDGAWSSLTGMPANIDTDVTDDFVLPTQTGNSGKALMTDGTNATWTAIPTELPAQASHAGKALMTDGTDATWTVIPAELPDVTSHGGKYLTTDGTNISWDNISISGNDIAMGSDAQGDIMYYDGTKYDRLAAGTNGQVLMMGVTSPEWGDHSAYHPVESLSGTATIASTTETVIITGNAVLTLPDDTPVGTTITLARGNLECTIDASGSLMRNDAALGLPYDLNSVNINVAVFVHLGFNNWVMR
ncbi:MAG: hypothetical protein ACEPOV_13665, partial [Hyphomicrobiales bacterium]